MEEVAHRLLDAKAAILALRAIPFQRRWVTELQAIQLKMEVAGTSRIENAEFVGDELEVAFRRTLRNNCGRDPRSKRALR